MADKDPWDLGGGGENFAFDRIGDEVEGHVIDMDTRQGTDMQTGELDFWDKEKTRPVMLTLLTLQTTLKDTPKDTGLRTVTLAGSKKPNPDGTKSRMCAARTAVLEATGGTAFEPGAWFKMRFTSEGVKTRPGFNAPKYFEAWYRSPVMDLDGQDRTPPVNQMTETQAGMNWPNTAVNQQQPNTAVNQQQPNTAVNQQSTAGTSAAGALTREQVEGVRALVGDDGIASVFGADWQSRVVG